MSETATTGAEPGFELVLPPEMAPVDPAGVWILVLNWNGFEDTVACVESLRHADLRGAKVVVIDNGSTDGSVARLQERFPDLRIEALPRNLGYAGGNNAGIATALAAGASGVLLLNNDTQVSPDFFPALVEALNSSPWAAAAVSAILRLDRPEMLDVAWCEVDFAKRHAVQIIGVNCLPGEGFDRRREVAVAIGCSLLIRSEALRALGSFDEAYFAYHEDVDWCLRARRKGYQLFYEPFSRVYHRGSGTTARSAKMPEDFQRAEASQGDPKDPLVANAAPLPWNPVRTYLGIRNTIRLMRSHANKKQMISFARQCLTELPLEFTSLVLNKRGFMRLGRWTYPIFFETYFIDRHPILRQLEIRGDGSARRRPWTFWLAFAVFFPVDLLWSWPREVLVAHRRGRLTEFWAYLAGLWDGVLNRPLPLHRLGLAG